MASPILALEAQRESTPAEPCALPEFASDPIAPSLGTYWRTLSRLRQSQIASLVWRRGPARLWRRLPVIPSGSVRLRKLPDMAMLPEWRPAAARRMLQSSVFRFLEIGNEAGKPLPWSDAALPRLWLYHFNSCDFLNLDLSRSGEERMVGQALRLMLDWCARNTTGREVGWEPYPLSLRIVNWLKFLLRNARSLETAGESAAVEQIVASLQSQSLVLERQLEFHLRANHLLKNLKALIFAGTLLETRASARWRKTGIRLLEEQIAEQILADGGHFERSPMYHAVVLEDLLDIGALLAADDVPSPFRAALPGKISAMARCLEAILHPDGEIPLLNDSAFGVAQPASQLLSRATESVGDGKRWNGEIIVLAETGYGVIREASTKSLLVFDSGPLGPNEQPGHGHCDTLSFELSIEGERVIVDTGASTYAPGPVRHYERSTAAHNTIRADGEEQAEIWGSFRVGRRPRSAEIQAAKVGGCRLLRGSHEGYQRLGLIHSRRIVHCPGQGWIVVDQLRGTGVHQLESFVHFHPEVVVEACSPAASPLPGGWRKCFEIRTVRLRYFLISSPLGSFALRQAWYSAAFGQRQKQFVAHWTWAGRLPMQILYALVPADRELPALGFSPDSDSLEIAGTRIPLN